MHKSATTNIQMEFLPSLVKDELFKDQHDILQHPQHPYQTSTTSCFKQQQQQPHQISPIKTWNIIAPASPTFTDIDNLPLQPTPTPSSSSSSSSFWSPTSSSSARTRSLSTSDFSEWTCQFHHSPLTPPTPILPQSLLNTTNTNTNTNTNNINYEDKSMFANDPVRVLKPPLADQSCATFDLQVDINQVFARLNFTCTDSNPTKQQQSSISSISDSNDIVHLDESIADKTKDEKVGEKSISKPPLYPSVTTTPTSTTTTNTTTTNTTTTNTTTTSNTKKHKRRRAKTSNEVVSSNVSDTNHHHKLTHTLKENEHEHGQEEERERALTETDEKKVTLYKTELCRSFEETGKCKFGTRCLFAHGIDEMRNVRRHPRYKTEICKSFWEEGQCKYGKRCCFLHVKNEDHLEQFAAAIVKKKTEGHHPEHFKKNTRTLSNPISSSRIEAIGLKLEDSDDGEEEKQVERNSLSIDKSVNRPADDYLRRMK